MRNIKIVYNDLFVLIKGRVWRYTQRGVIFKIFSEDELLVRPEIITELINDGFKTMEVFLNKQFVDVPIDFKYVGNQDRKMEIGFKKPISINEVSESYRFVISVEIKGKEIETFYIPKSDPSIRFVNITSDETYQPAIMSKEKEELFGKPVEQEPGSIFWEYPIWRTNLEYRQPFSAIDKIIGTKKFYSTDAIGAENEYAKTKFTGKEERIVLDLHNFDENIYNIFKAHNNCVDIEWE